VFYVLRREQKQTYRSRQNDIFDTIPSRFDNRLFSRLCNVHGVVACHVKVEWYTCHPAKESPRLSEQRRHEIRIERSQLVE
jgi:hypothetical protein